MISATRRFTPRSAAAPAAAAHATALGKHGMYSSATYEGEPVGQPEYREPSLRPRQLTAIYAERAGAGPKAGSHNHLMPSCIIAMIIIIFSPQFRRCNDSMIVDDDDDGRARPCDDDIDCACYSRVAQKPSTSSTLYQNQYLPCISAW